MSIVEKMVSCRKMKIAELDIKKDKKSRKKKEKKSLFFICF